MKGGSAPETIPAATSPAAARGGVLLGVGTVAVAVLEIDAEVFHRLAAELLSDAVVHRHGQLRGEPDRGGEGFGVRGVLVEAAQRQVAELAGRVGAEQVGAAVDGVHGLPGGGVAGVALRVRGERRPESIGLLAFRHENAGTMPRRS